MAGTFAWKDSTQKEVVFQESVELNVNDSSDVTIHFSDKSFKMTGKTLKEAIEHYWSTKTSWKAEVISARMDSDK